MKTLVIHPKDITTDFLSDIYKDKDWTVITTNPSKSFLKKEIKSHDRIIMLGHGTEMGLLGFDRFIIDSSLVYLLRDKYCVCIWCDADMFVTKYKLTGFYTGMFISEIEESYLFSVRTSYDDLQDSNKLFAESVSKYIDSDDILEGVKKTYIGDSHVVKYNSDRLYHS